MGRVDVPHRHSGPARLVCDEGAELGEGPGVDRDALGLLQPCPFADAAEIFQGDAAAGALGLRHDVLADLVVDVAGAPGFLSRAAFGSPFGGSGVLPCEVVSVAAVVLSAAVEVPATVPVAGRGGGDVGDAEVDADESPRIRGGGGFRDVDGGQEVPVAVLAGQVGFALAMVGVGGR